MRKKQGSAGTAATVGGLGIFALVKSKFLFVAIKLLKFKSLWTMLLTIWAYALLYGWKFGVAFVYLMFIRELGHFYAAKYKKVPTSLAIFIPFFGTLTGTKEFPKSLKDDVFIAIMGPVAGLLSLVPFFIIFQVTGDAFWIRMLMVGAIFNLFNLLPVMPLDGGRVARALSGKLLMLGFFILLTFVIFRPNPVVIIIAIFSVVSTFSRTVEQYRWKQKVIYKEVYSEALQRWDELRAAYYQIEEENRVSWLNVLIYEEEQKKEALYPGLIKVQDKASKWRWTPATEQWYRLSAKFVAQNHFIQHLNDWYDAEPEPFQTLEATVDELSTEVAKKEAYERLTTKQRTWILVQYISLVLIFSICIGYVVWLGL